MLPSVSTRYIVTWNLAGPFSILSSSLTLSYMAACLETAEHIQVGGLFVVYVMQTQQA